MPEGLKSLAEAFAEADPDVEAGVEPCEGDETSPLEVVEEVSEEQAAIDGGEQPEETDNSEDEELQDLLDEMVDEEVPDDEVASGLDIGSPEFWDLEVDVGDGSVTLREAVDGYLRQADYTKKTQALSAERKDLDDAKDFLAAFREDPNGFAYSLALRAGLIQEDEAMRPMDVPGAAIRSEEEVQAEVDRRIEEQLADDPRIRQAELAQAQVAVNRQFAEIEQTHGVQLNAEHRNAIAQEAVARGTGDLDLVFQAMLNRTRVSRAKRAELQRSSPSRPKSSTQASDESEERRVIHTVVDAYDAAQAELSNQQ